MGIFSGGKASSSGNHGGGHQVRQRGANASSRKAAARQQNAKIAGQRGGKSSTDGRKGKPSGK